MTRFRVHSYLSMRTAQTKRLSGVAGSVVLTDYIGKFFITKSPFMKWSSYPGDGFVSPKQLSALKAGDSVGTILAIEKGSDGKYWAKTNRGGWFNFNAYASALQRKVLDPVVLTDEQKKDVILNIAKSQGGLVNAGANVTELAIDVGNGVSDTISSVFNFGKWIGKNLKPILITAGVGTGLYLGYKVYKNSN